MSSLRAEPPSSPARYTHCCYLSKQLCTNHNPGPQKHLLRSTCRSTQVSKPNTHIWALRDDTVHTGVIQANVGFCFLLILRVSSCEEQSRLTGPPFCAYARQMNWSCQAGFCQPKGYEIQSLWAYMFSFMRSVWKANRRCVAYWKVQACAQEEWIRRGLMMPAAVKREILSVLRLNQHLNFFNHESRQPTPAPTVQTPYLT